MQGKTINGFTLQRLLGTGGMAEVWYAENKIGKKAAVKLLLPKFCADEVVKERFHTEAKVMVALNHSNIRQVYDYGELEGRPTIVMEYLDGSDLKARMKQGQRFTQEELVKWWNQMVDALNYTHGQDIVHRDIKPSNIFVDAEGNAKLLDFGIAKVRDSISATQTEQKLGTLMYMSPEQVRDPKRVGAASDAYSLAVTFVHLLTGKPPYDSSTDSDYDIQESIVRRPLDLSDVPLGWRDFLAPYLEKDPEKRPALQHYTMHADAPELGDEEETEVGVGSPSPEPEPKPKKALWIGLGIAALLALLLLILWPKKTIAPADPDTMAYEACQTVDDYRAYLHDYGDNAQHYADAQAFVDRWVADSLATADSLAQAEAEALLQAQLQAEEEVAYSKCTTIAGCVSYLNAYPEGKYVQQVEAKKAELEEQARQDADKKEEDAYKNCTTLTGCEKYLKEYPYGKYADDVKARMTELEEYEAYSKCTTINACLAYLNAYPRGKYVQQVEAKKAELEEQARQDADKKDENAHKDSGTVDGHEYVDLGLPSGTLWATCNLGASRPEDYGNYYAWGETKPQPSNTYSWSSYKYAKGNNFNLTKYCSKSEYGHNGFRDNLTTLQGTDDPATANWGSAWRSPSYTQWDELLKNTTQKWTTQNGVKGLLFTSRKNGRVLFLPSSGTAGISDFASISFYLSRSIHNNRQDEALGFCMVNQYKCDLGSISRCYGCTVRPVHEK